MGTCTCFLIFPGFAPTSRRLASVLDVSTNASNHTSNGSQNMDRPFSSFSGSMSTALSANKSEDLTCSCARPSARECRLAVSKQDILEEELNTLHTNATL